MTTTKNIIDFDVDIFSLYSGNTLEKVNTLAYTHCVSFFSLMKMNEFFEKKKKLKERKLTNSFLQPYGSLLIWVKVSEGLKRKKKKIKCGWGRHSPNGDSNLTTFSSFLLDDILFLSFLGDAEVRWRPDGSLPQQHDEIVSFPNHFSSAMK